MKLVRTIMTSMALIAGAAAASASEAETSASAGAGRNGTANAAARYSGDIGFARTETRSGATNMARGTAVGVDKNGISVSISNAVAPSGGPAVAMTYNLSIGRDGSVSRSGGVSVAEGSIHRTAAAGGSVGTGRYASPATSFASGGADRFGRVETRTHSSSSGPLFARPRLSAPPEAVRSVKTVHAVKRVTVVRTAAARR